MTPLKQAFIYILLTLAAVLSQKNSDESRPYEFGFTIDGEQHRHEKKDQNGIIQGEFGFITADGVYHVTVYATDENGNFKILSMRNIRISAPLDGSPATGPISPEAGKYLGKQKQIGNVPASQPGTQPPRQPQPPPQYPQSSRPPLPPSQQIAQPLQLPQSPQSPQTVTQSSKLYEFTTQSTIKPACGGCGYVTTAKPVNGQSFQFQNPAFQNPGGLNGASLSNSVPSAQNGQGGLGGAGGVSGLVQGPASSQYQQQSGLGQQNGLGQQQQLGQNLQSGGNLAQQGLTGGLLSPGLNQQRPGGSLLPPGTSQQGLGGGLLSGTNQQRPGGSLLSPGTSQRGLAGGLLSGTNQQRPGGSLLPPGTSQQYQDNNSRQGLTGQNGNGYQSGNPINDQDFGLFGSKNAGANGRIQFPATSGTSNEFVANPLTQRHKGVSKLPPVSVADSMIHVGGDKPINIPIRDKYPGMVNGLPDGIEEKDIKDLLYKFHYTVGFHGHYEKGLKNGAKIGGYFVNGRDGISRVVTYVADENGYRPKFKFINLGLDSPDTPKEGSEKKFGLKSFEFVWYPVD